MRQRELFVSLKKRRDISELFKDSAKISGPHIFFRYRRHSENAVFVLFTVPRGTRPAVLRNRYKRILRATLFEAMREITNNRGAILSGFSIGLFPAATFFSLDFSARLSEIRRIEKLWDKQIHHP